MYPVLLTAVRDSIMLHNNIITMTLRRSWCPNEDIMVRVNTENILMIIII